jgi:signal transduction histidine kinase
LQNLVDNAVKYGERARISVQENPDGVSIQIEDDGPGLPPALLSKVFEPFYRAETSRNRGTGGTGLGLAIARTCFASRARRSV